MYLGTSIITAASPRRVTATVAHTFFLEDFKMKILRAIDIYGIIRQTTVNLKQLW